MSCAIVDTHKPQNCCSMSIRKLLKIVKSNKKGINKIHEVARDNSTVTYS